MRLWGKLLLSGKTSRDLKLAIEFVRTTLSFVDIAFIVDVVKLFFAKTFKPMASQVHPSQF
jgi:hypothetical protein